MQKKGKHSSEVVFDGAYNAGDDGRVNPRRLPSGKSSNAADPSDRERGVVIGHVSFKVGV